MDGACSLFLFRLSTDVNLFFVVPTHSQRVPRDSEGVTLGFSAMLGFALP